MAETYPGGACARAILGSPNSYATPGRLGALAAFGSFRFAGAPGRRLIRGAAIWDLPAGTPVRRGAAEPGGHRETRRADAAAEELTDDTSGPPAFGVRRPSAQLAQPNRDSDATGRLAMLALTLGAPLRRASMRPFSTYRSGTGDPLDARLDYAAGALRLAAAGR